MVRRAILLGVLFLVGLVGCQSSNKIDWGPPPIPGSWHALPVLPSPVSGVATAVLGSNFYVIGGGPSGQQIPTEVFDLLTTNGNWTAGPVINETQSQQPFDFQGGAVTLGNRIYYLTCCNSGGGTDDFWVLEAGAWSKLAGPPEQVSGFAMGAMQGRIYIAGGVTANPSGNGDNASSQLYAFDTSSGTWSTPLQTLPEPISSLAGTVVGGTAFYVAGSGSAFRYDPSPVDKWTPLTPDPDERATALVAVGGRIFSVGGVFFDNQNGGENGTDRMEVYDIASDSWLPAPRLPQAVAEIQPAVLGSGIYVAGPGYTSGGDGFGLPPTTTFEVFHPGG